MDISIIDSIDAEVKRTTIKKRARNPVWNEILVFGVGESSVLGTKVLVRVLDGDDVVGEVVVVVEEDMLDGNPMWFDLEDKVNFSWRTCGKYFCNYSGRLLPIFNKRNLMSVTFKRSTNLNLLIKRDKIKWYTCLTARQSFIKTYWEQQIDVFVFIVFLSMK